MRRFVLLSLLLTAGCGPTAEMDNMLPPATRAILSAPDSVRAFRLNLGPYPKDMVKPKTWPEVPTSAEAPVEGAVRDEIRRLLLDSSSYDWEGKGCIPRPGVKIRFTRGTSTAEVYVCLECLMLNFGAGPPENPYWGSWDPIASKFLRIVKGLFPNDAELQAVHKNW